MTRSALLFALCFAVASVTAVILVGFPAPNLLFGVAILGHAVAGLLLLPLAVMLYRRLRSEPLGWAGVLSGLFFVASAGLGLFLVIRGNYHQQHAELMAHLVFSVLLLISGLLWMYQAGWLAPRLRLAVSGATVLALVIPAVALLWRHSHPSPDSIIVNRVSGYVSMVQEDGGKGPFFPSGAHTIGPNGKRDVFLSEHFFENSKSCARCHAQIYREWKSSAHHYASFNNQFYRASIEYMQQVQGSTKPSQWCAACHDSAVLFTGKWKTPIKYQIHTPAAQAGLGCQSCHAVVHIHNTLGNSAFTLEDPPLHKLAESKNPFLRFAHDAVLHLDPRPHDETFLKPFEVNQPSQFCSACHKVHLDVPVDHYRWSRGFDEYDNWQGSGVSGQGARSFYYPPKPLVCTSCHMPLVRSNDPAARNGFIRSHRFIAANTAVPWANEDKKQLADEIKFLQGAVSTDIFAIAHTAAQPKKQITNDNTPSQESMFGQGEESSASLTPSLVQSGGKVRVDAPLNVVQPVLHAGSSIRVDVVERTLRLGHFFPGGTIDAADVWLEMKALDGKGHPFFWSGFLQPDGHVDRTAHFYRAVLLDAHGNVINKRNAWAARTVVYVHLIPPGAADTVHYRIRIPKNITGPVTLIARLHYRKFIRDFSNFAYVGKMDPGAYTLDYDDRKMSLDGSLADVSGKRKQIPQLPIVTISEDKVVLPLQNGNQLWKSTMAAAHDDQVRLRTRWNDYGIGLLLQGDLTGAQNAFEQVTRIDPKYADGWLNVARVKVREGETEQAKPYLAKALALSPNLPRACFFRAEVEKADGNYDAALKDLNIVLKAFPQDRVVLNQAGRVLFLERHYHRAITYLLRSTAVDPENVEAHYDLMLCYRGAGQISQSRLEERLYERFKADESSKAVAGAFLLAHPNANNEAQPVHEHGNGLTARQDQPARGAAMPVMAISVDGSGKRRAGAPAGGMR